MSKLSMTILLPRQINSIFTIQGVNQFSNQAGTSVSLSFPPDIGDMKRLRIGDKVASPFEHTISDSYRTLHNLSVMECSRLYTSSPFARSLKFRDILVPFPTLPMLAIGNMVIQGSEPAVAHVGLFNGIQTEPVYYGDTLRSTGTFTGLERKSNGRYDLSTFQYNLENVVTGKSVFQIVKRTLFPSGTFDKSNLDMEPIDVIKNDLKNQNIASQLVATNPPKLKDVAQIKLQSGDTFVHKLIYMIHSFDFDHVMNFYQVTNDLHRNRVRLPNEKVFAKGPLVVTKSLYNIRLDFGEIYAPMIVKSANIVSIAMDDMISSISCIRNVKQINQNWEEVELITIGLKNIDPSSILNLEVPRAMLADVLLAKQYKEICQQSCPVLEDKIACSTVWRFLRQRD